METKDIIWIVATIAAGGTFGAGLGKLDMAIDNSRQEALQAAQIADTAQPSDTGIHESQKE